MINKNKNWLLILCTIILIIIFTPIFGWFFKEYLGPYSVGFWGPQHPEYLDGFFAAIAFFIPLLFVVMGTKNKYKIIIFLEIIILIILLFLKSGKNFVVSLIAAILGWLIGEGILRLYQLAKKR
ncbi:MAG: hypothetical protein WCT16_01490 [Candidatus Buchananbacteria bacterium]